MADILKLVTGERYVNDDKRIYYYLGTYQTDGWIYFNDDKFWRHHPDFEITQVLYLSNEVWVNTNMLEITSITDFNGQQAQNMINGAGGIAPNGDVETAVQWMINKANNEYITYSQSTRNLKNPNGSSYDCSSFVITGFYMGGFDANATYTGNMRSAFEALGFTWIPGNVFPASECKRGDILLHEIEHTQVYIGNNQDVNCGSTPARVITHAPDRWGGYWDGILRYAG